MGNVGVCCCRGTKAGKLKEDGETKRTETGFEPEVKYLTSVFLQRKDGRKKKRDNRKRATFK